MYFVFNKNSIYNDYTINRFYLYILCEWPICVDSNCCYGLEDLQGVCSFFGASQRGQIYIVILLTQASDLVCKKREAH